MDKITEWDKTVLVEGLIHDGWDVGAAWAAAADPANVVEYQDGSVGYEVIACSDDYSEAEQQAALHPNGY